MKTLQDIIEGLTPKTHALLGLSWFAEQLGRSPDKALYDEVMQFTKGENAALEVFGIYYAPDGDEHIIEDENFETYLTEGFFVCPQEGIVIDNPDEVMSIYWACREAPSPEHSPH